MGRKKWLFEKFGRLLAEQTEKGARQGRPNLLTLLEAAIGIEPMNKGFAVSEGLFSQVLVDAFACGFVGVPDTSCLGVFSQIRGCFD